MQGTNTYLIGEGPPYILFDAGDAVDAYIPLLESALQQSVAQSESASSTSSGIRSPRSGVHPLVSDIIISHRHHDHHGGLPAVLSLLHTLGTTGTRGSLDKSDIHDAAATAELDSSSTSAYFPPRIHKLPSPWQKKASLFSAESEGASFDSTLKAISQLPITQFEHSKAPPSDASGTHSSTGTTDAIVNPLVHDLADGQTIRTETTGAPSIELTVLHTPGHTTDSISLLLPAENAMFSADTVLGQGTAVFEDLGEYMRSLQKMLDAGRALIRRSDDGKSVDKKEETMMRIYPGHGPVIEDGLKTLQTYISHRAEREAQILALLPSPTNPPNSGELMESQPSSSIHEIVRTLYAKYPQAVWPAAERGVWLHLEKLESEGKVAIAGADSPSSSSSLLDTGVDGDIGAVFGRLRDAKWIRQDVNGKNCFEKLTSHSCR